MPRSEHRGARRLRPGTARAPWIRRLLVGGVCGLTAGGIGFAGLLGNVGTAGATSSFAITQLAGTNRFATAADIATTTFPNGAATVIVASGLATNLPDSLAASYLAAQENGGAGAPILLVNSDTVPAETTAALIALKATSVVIVGGTGAVSTSVATTFTAAHLAVTRVAGSSRFATAAAIDSQTGMTNVGTVGSKKWAIVASGVDANLVDALGASPIAYAEHFPLLLVNGPTGVLSSADLAILSTDGIDNVLIVGGTASVGSQVDTQLTNLHYTPVTEAGPNRSATSQTLADYAITNFAFSTTHFNVASGDQAHLVDSLAGGPHGGAEKAPTLITGSVDNAGSAASFAAEHTATETSADLFGGTASVDATAEAAIVAAAQAATSTTATSTTSTTTTSTTTSTTTTSTPAPIPLSGTGQTATQPFPVVGGLTIFTATCSACQANFIVEIDNASGSFVDIPIDVIGAYTGSVAEQLSAGSYILNVTADAAWTINVTQPRNVPGAVLPQTYSGSGQQVVGPFAAGSSVRLQAQNTSTGGGNFIVEILAADGSFQGLPFNTIGSFSGSTISNNLTGSPYWLTIDSDGTWTITVSLG